MLEKDGAQVGFLYLCFDQSKLCSLHVCCEGGGSFDSYPLGYPFGAGWQGNGMTQMERESFASCT